jgi:hypothetical protein
MKGHIVIEEFQPLQGLEIVPGKTEIREGHIYSEVVLHNNTGHAILTNHISDPVLAVMQNNVELAAVSLFMTGKNSD